MRIGKKEVKNSVLGFIGSLALCTPLGIPVAVLLITLIFLITDLIFWIFGKRGFLQVAHDPVKKSNGLEISVSKDIFKKVEET